MKKRRNYRKLKEPTSSARLTTGPYKYTEVWQRARLKIWQLRMMRTSQFQRTAETEASPQTSDLLLLQPQPVDVHIHDHDFEGPLPTCVLDPNGRIRSLWNAVILLLLLYTATIMPFRISFIEFHYMDTWHIVDITVDLLFFVDVCLNCISSYYRVDGTLERSRTTIFCRYAKTWMLLDIAACVPVDIIIWETNNSRNSNNFIRLLRLPRLYRLVKATKIYKAILSKKSKVACMRRLYDYLSIRTSQLRFALALLIALLLAHNMACLWYYIAVLQEFRPDTWVVKHDHIDSLTPELYLACLYWSLTTMTTVGYGDLSAHNSIEHLVTTCWMIIGVFIFSFMIGSLTSIINSYDSEETLLIKKIQQIDEICRETQLDTSIQRRLNHAVAFKLQKEGSNWKKRTDIFERLPRALRHEVALSMHDRAARTIPFFASQDIHFVAAIVPRLRIEFCAQNTIIYKEGDFAEHIYFIKMGQIGFLYRLARCYKTLNTGSYFGDLEFVKKVPRIFTVRSALNCEFLTLSRKEMDIIEANFPLVHEQIIQHSELRESELQRALNKLKQTLGLPPDLTSVRRKLVELKTAQLNLSQYLKKQEATMIQEYIDIFSGVG